MDESVARTIIFLGQGIGALIWVVAMRSLRRIVAAPSEISHDTLVEHDLKRTQSVLLKSALDHKSQTSPEGVHVVDDQDGRISFQLSGGSTVECVMDESYDGTHVQATADLSALKRRYRYIMTGLVVFLIPAVVLGVGYVLLHFAVPSPNPGVRWQCAQICQIAHVLWPPFLVSKLFHTHVQHADNFVRKLLVTAQLAGDDLAAT
jgi:hypothetical protein